MARLQKISQGLEDRNRNLRDGMSLIIVENRNTITSKPNEVDNLVLSLAPVEVLCKFSCLLVPPVLFLGSRSRQRVFHSSPSSYTKLFCTNSGIILSQLLQCSVQIQVSSPRVKFRTIASLLRLLFRLVINSCRSIKCLTASAHGINRIFRTPPRKPAAHHWYTSLETVATIPLG